MSRGLSGDEYDRIARRIDALHGRLEDSLGQIAAHLRDRVPDVVDGSVDRRSDLQLNDGLAVAFADRAIDLVDSVDPADGRFDLLRHLLFHLGRRRSGLAHADQHDREVDVRILRDRHLAERDQSGEHQADE